MTPRTGGETNRSGEESQRSGGETPFRPGRKSATALDFDPTPLLAEPFPVWGWLLETTAGPILVDTGPSAYANRLGDPGRASTGRLRYKFSLQFTVTPEQELPAALAVRGVSPADIRSVLLTHLHPDHAGGLEHFPQAEFRVGRRELEAARRQPQNYGASRWPAWFEPRPVDYEPWPIGPFDESLGLPGVSGLWLVPTAGHTAGHLSVLIRGGAHWTLLAGDAVFSQSTLLAGQLVGQADDPRLARQTQDRIRSFAREAPLLLLPAHDPQAAERLATGSTAPA